MTRTYRLRDASNRAFTSMTPGTLGGDRRNKLYGRLDCASALKAIVARGTYQRYRVFFADEITALAAGYRPCSRCMPEARKAWNASREDGTAPSPM